MARGDDTGPTAPRLQPVRPSGLVVANPAAVVDGDEDLDDVEVRGLRAAELVWTGRRRLSASVLADIVVNEWRARDASFVDSVLDGVAVVALSAPGSGWRSVEVRGSRIGSAELYDTALRHVRFSHCKLGYVNLRAGTLADVSFDDCVVDELDLGGATLERAAFEGTRIGRLLVPGARLRDVDLRGARLDDVEGVDGLRGATLALDQLLDLAPTLATRLGILLT